MTDHYKTMSQTQANLTDYESGGTSNAERREHTGHQRPLHSPSDDSARLDIPESVGGYERTTAPYAGEIVRWSDGTDSVSIIRTIGTGATFEVTGADTSRSHPGRHIAAAQERAQAIQLACAHMRGGAGLDH